MNIYDKNQEAYKNYLPLEESRKLFKISVLKLWEAGVIFLCASTALVFGLLRSNARLWIMISLYCLTFLLIITEYIHHKRSKNFYTDPKVYHDYYFCIYRTAPPDLAQRCLAFMAEICLIYGYKAQAEGALGLINAGKLKGRSLESYKRTTAVLDGRMNAEEMLGLFNESIKTLSETRKKLSNLELLILFIYVLLAIDIF